MSSDEFDLRNAESNFEQMTVSEASEPQVVGKECVHRYPSGDVIKGYEVRETGNPDGWIFSTITVDAEQP
jgi:hypothetical protein